MSIVMSIAHAFLVAPFMGAWIEITMFPGSIVLAKVAPFMGAWIEILAAFTASLVLSGRSLHGSVD